jgi:hypothetical protein
LAATAAGAIDPEPGRLVANVFISITRRNGATSPIGAPRSGASCAIPATARA